MELDYNDFIKMEEIDKQYFPEENISPAGEAYKWYLADENSCIVVKEEKDVVAYINMLSLKKNIYDKIKLNKMNESEIKVSDLELAKEKYYNYLYFSAIAVDKKYRSASALRKLLYVCKNHIRKLLDKGVKFIEVMADCSTDEGAKITKHILKLKPFIKTSHGSVIYFIDGQTFLKNFLNY